MNSARTFAACLALAALVAGAVYAAGGDRREARRAERVDRLFEALDANRDGAIDAAEREAARAGRFAEMDADADGKVSRAEMEAHAAKRAAEIAGRRFARLDVSGDGVIDRAEMEAAPHGGHGRGHGRHGRALDRMDADDDGRITREEALSHRWRGRSGE